MVEGDRVALPVEERTAPERTAETIMSTHDDTRSTPDRPSDAEAYDPAQDPDADPESLNPRTGSQARGGSDEADDTDSDPDSLNPRAAGDGAAPQDEPGA